MRAAWGKHTPAQYKWKHATKQASDIRKEDVLPVVTVRNPWRWMQSMCKNPYAAHWSHYHQCPNLKDPATERNWNQVTVKFGAATEIYQSLPHLWNDWYNDYLKASEPTFSNDRDERHYPWIMVRMEDLVFHTVETVTDVCECAGGRLYEDRPFHYITDSAKADSPGHDTSTGIAEAWIKYSQPLRAGAGFTPSDYASALEAIDQKIMDHLHYHHPPPAAALDQR